MSDLKKGDRVTVRLPDEPDYSGVISGEGRGGQWWLLIKDGTKHPRGIHKGFCHPEETYDEPD